MNKYKSEKSSESENSEVDIDDSRRDKDNKKNVIDNKNIYSNDDSSNDDVNIENEKYYDEAILNHHNSKRKQKGSLMRRCLESDDVDDDDNLSYIVHAVLEELNAEKANEKNSKKERDDERTVRFARQIDRYLTIDHIKRNQYLVSHNEFQRKLKKLMKSLYNLDSCDEGILKFNETEKSLMKIFFKEKQEHHDRRFMMVENNIFLNMLRKISKYLKKC